MEPQVGRTGIVRFVYKAAWKLSMEGIVGLTHGRTVTLSDLHPIYRRLQIVRFVYG